MQSINTQQYREISQDNEKKIIIFSAPWCQPCRMFKPVLDKVSTDLAIPCYTINIDDEMKPKLKYCRVLLRPNLKTKSEKTKSKRLLYSTGPSTSL